MYCLSSICLLQIFSVLEILETVSALYLTIIQLLGRPATRVSRSSTVMTPRSSCIAGRTFPPLRTTSKITNEGEAGKVIAGIRPFRGCYQRVLFRYLSVQIESTQTRPRQTMTDPNVQEGKVPFSVSGLDKPCNTWYKTFGDLRSGKNPLIVLHGGPGAR